MEMTNNTVLITGGTSGIGLEFAKQLVQAGNKVIVTGRDKRKLQQVKTSLPEIEIFQSDVSQIADILKLQAEITKKFPALNVLINNAGEMQKINLHQVTDPTEIVREIDTNLSGPIRMVQAFLPHLKAQPAAVIINVTSGLALIPYPIAPIYGAAKAGLRSYTISLRVQLRHTNVKVVELLPPAVATPLNDKFEEDVDLKSLMPVDKLVAAALNGLVKGQLEVYPGMAKAIKLMSKVAPGFLLKQLSKTVDKLIEEK